MHYVYNSQHAQFPGTHGYIGQVFGLSDDLQQAVLRTIWMLTMPQTGSPGYLWNIYCQGHNGMYTVSGHSKDSTIKQVNKLAIAIDAQ